METKMTFATIAMIFFASIAYADPIPTDAELTAKELTTVAPDRRAFSPARATYVMYPIQYMAKFNFMIAAPEKPLSQDSNFKTASNLSSDARTLNAVKVGFPSASTSVAGNALGAASLAFGVIDFFVSFDAKKNAQQKSDKNFLNGQRSNFDTPTLMLVSLQKNEGLDNQSIINTKFREADHLFRSLPIGCEPAISTSPKAEGGYLHYGSYAPEFYHLRGYLCGYASNHEVDKLIPAPQRRALNVYRLGADTVPNEYDNGVYAYIDLSHLADMKAAVEMLDPSGEVDAERLPQLLFEKIKDDVPDGWYVLYTLVNEDKKRVIMFGNKEYQVAFELPPKL